MDERDKPTVAGVHQLRAHLRNFVDSAVEHGQHTILTRHGRPVAVLVDYEWYAHTNPTSDS